MLSALRREERGQALVKATPEARERFLSHQTPEHRIEEEALMLNAMNTQACASRSHTSDPSTAGLPQVACQRCIARVTGGFPASASDGIHFLITVTPTALFVAAR